MTTFPFIALGTHVQYKDKDYHVRAVDFSRSVFCISLADRTGDWVYDIPFSDYKPASTKENLNRMLEEWDYYCNMSDDERIVEQGREQLAAMVHMFRDLRPEDQLYYRKILAVMVDEEFTRKS